MLIDQFFPAAPYRLPANLESRLMTPALVIHREIVERNLARIFERLDGDPNRWRPHLKTTKSPDLWRILLDRGIRQFKCATVREARVLLELAKEAGCASVDLLIAYPHVEPALTQLSALARRYVEARIAVLSDEPTFAESIPHALGVFADLDSGMHRTGLASDRWDAWIPTARTLGERFRGVHYYDGHLRDPDLEVRTRLAAQGYEELLDFVTRVRKGGVKVGEVITSGTPTFLPALQHAGLRALSTSNEGSIHRVSAGTVVLHDAGYAEIASELDLVPAAVVMSRVISAPMKGRITLDAGSKSLAAECGDPCAFIAGRPGWRALPPSEEHLPVDIGDAAPPARGACFALIPRHICPTVNLAERAIFIEGDTWREIDIAARAHDLLASP